jgi:hypothetical protein
MPILHASMLAPPSTYLQVCLYAMWMEWQWGLLTAPHPVSDDCACNRHAVGIIRILLPSSAAPAHMAGPPGACLHDVSTRQEQQAHAAASDQLPFPVPSASSLRHSTGRGPFAWPTVTVVCHGPCTGLGGGAGRSHIGYALPSGYVQGPWGPPCAALQERMVQCKATACVSPQHTRVGPPA